MLTLITSPEKETGMSFEKEKGFVLKRLRPDKADRAFAKHPVRHSSLRCGCWYVTLKLVATDILR